MTKQELNKACEIVRDLANEYFGDWEQSCKFEDKFRKAMTEKTNPLFEKCLANVDPDTRKDVRENMDAVWHKVPEELPPVDTEVICKMKGVPHTGHFICKWDGEYWMYWAYFRDDIQGWSGLNPEWEVTEWKEI